MRTLTSIFAAGFVALALTACGGDSGIGELGAGGTGTSKTGTGGGTTGNGGTTTTTPVYSMGNGTGSSFQSGMIGVTSASLSAGGSTSLSISIVNQQGTLYTSSSAVVVTINSPCVAGGMAEISATSGGAAVTSISTTTGIADAVYTAKGCSGSDVITATATVGSQTLTATGTVNVAAATVGSLQFVSATPSSIGLKGTGLNETSTVVFKVVDSTGAPTPNAQVSFTLNTTVGGLTISPATATSAQDGTVQTVVSSGTQHTAVRVTATIQSPALSTQSSVLTVTTGLPTNNTFSIAVGPPSYASNGPGCSNVETYTTDLIKVPFTVQLADRYGNPAPDGTAVAFSTDAGNIGGNCTTPLATPGDGSCKVTWSSANPRPSPSTSPPALRNGRGVILATAIGEDSFDDVNGNGFWDPGEPFTDLGEPYRDDNENGQYDLGEYFLDFNKNSVRDGPSSTFRGITCTSGACTSTTVAIGAQHLIIMSTSGANIFACPSASGEVPVPSPICPSYSMPTTITHGTGGSFEIVVQDQNSNSMPAGTTISISADSSIGSISGITSSYTVPCDEAVGGQVYVGNLNTITSLPTGATSVSGNVYIQVKSPGGTLTTAAFPVTVD